MAAIRLKMHLDNLK